MTHASIIAHSLSKLENRISSAEPFVSSRLMRQGRAPSNHLAVDDAMSRLDKRIRWYGFKSWTVAAVGHNQNGDLLAEIEDDGLGVVCVANISANTGSLHYKVRNRSAFRNRNL